MDINTLNSRFAIPSHIRFAAGAGGLTAAEIANAGGTATVYLYGAHIAAFQPAGEKPVLWLSPQAIFTPGKPIRGGIPVCWPNFGSPPTGSPLPFHGFARLREWAVLSTKALAADRTELRLGLDADDGTRALWPFPFALEMRVTVGREMEVELLIRNPGDRPFPCSAALHTYFAVSEVANVTVSGLENTDYIDTVPVPHARRRQEGVVTFTDNVDRLYTGTAATCLIHDPGWNRRIQVAKRNSRSTVVWTPWEAKAAKMADLGSGNWHGMLCVETTNAGDDSLTLAPGAEHRLVATLSVLPGAG